MTRTDEPHDVVGADPVVDRAVWERLRRAAHLGHLQPEGDRVLQTLHTLYPEWRGEFL